jgi:hypothetical protein
MRTTVTLDSDVELRLTQLMRERGLTFKDALNTTLRAGFGMESRTDVAFPVFDMGEPRVDLTHANQLAGALENGEVARSLTVGR